jgi:hypothetical protein
MSKLPQVLESSVFALSCESWRGYQATDIN